MKRLLIGVVPLMLANIALAGGAPDLVVGAARFDLGPGFKIEIMAKSDADGQNAQGRFSYREVSTGVGWQGEVICLNVFDYRALAVGYVVESTKPGRQVGDVFFQYVDDFGDGNSDKSQTFVFRPPPGSLPPLQETCAVWDVVNGPPLARFEPVFETDRGNYEVRDRQP